MDAKAIERGLAQLDAMSGTDDRFAARRTVQSPQKPATYATPSYCVVNILELANHTFMPREQILSPWCLTQSLNMIYAWRGVGKTHVALGIAFAIATGGAFLCWRATTRRKVLYLDGEMPGASLQNRLTALIAASDVDFDPDYFRILTPDLQEGAMPDICTLEGQFAVEDLIGDAEVIIVDNLSSLARSGGNENAAESVEMTSGWALRMRQQKRTVIFIHHSGKGGEQRGTSKREDILDVVISLKRPPDYQPSEGAKFEVHFQKGRDLQGEDAQPFEAALTTSADGRQSWAISKLEDSTFDRVVALANEGLSQTEIAVELGINKSNVSRHIKRGHAQKLIKGDSK
jgi:DNA-directed RNA polymerase specialized sigma24 family protein